MSTNNRFRLYRGPYPQGNSLLVILRLDEKKTKHDYPKFRLLLKYFSYQ